MTSRTCRVSLPVICMSSVPATPSSTACCSRRESVETAMPCLT